MSKVARAKSPMGRLTENQYDLLLYVLSGPILQAEEGPTKWSPTRFLGRVPSRSQSVILSKRLSSLIDRGLIKREGDEVRLTSLGYRVLNIYVDIAEDSEKATYTSFLLKLEELSKQSSQLREASSCLLLMALSKTYTHDIPLESIEIAMDVLARISRKLSEEIFGLRDYVRQPSKNLSKDTDTSQKV